MKLEGRWHKQLMWFSLKIAHIKQHAIKSSFKTVKPQLYKNKAPTVEDNHSFRGADYNELTTVLPVWGKYEKSTYP